MNTQTKGINQEKMQEFFGSMISKMNEQGTDTDPFGALKSMQQVAEAWTKNPQELNQSMQNWSQKIGEVNMKVWNEFANKSKESPYLRTVAKIEAFYFIDYIFVYE